MSVRERMLQMVREMAPTEEIRLATAWLPEAITDVRRTEYLNPRNLRSHMPWNTTSCPCGQTAFLVWVQQGWSVQCPSCGRQLLYPRRSESGALQAFDSGRILDPPSHTASGM